MLRRSQSLALLLLCSPIGLGISAAAEDQPPAPQPRQPFQAPPVDDPGAFIEAQTNAQWSKPERRKWRIVYHPIKGASDRSSWHIEGTHWWVRLYPDYYKLEDLDKTQVYEFDAVALRQMYGVIDFYLYERPRALTNTGNVRR